MLKKVKLFEVVPGTKIMVAELSEIPADNDCENCIKSTPRFHSGAPVPNQVPEQWLRNKLAKNNGWSVVSSGYDNDTASFWFECAINASTTERRFIDADAVCKCMHWKSWSFINRGLSVKFVDDPAWFEQVPVTVKPKKRGRKAKSAK